MVILLSTRGTAGSDIWFMCLADKPMVRGYHLTDYDWTPLSQNPAQTCDDTVSASASGGSDIRGSTAFRRPRWRSHSDTAVSRLGSAGRSGRKYTHPMQRRGAKSFVDDLVLSRGVVLSRAAASLRSIEIKPFDWKICPLWTGNISLLYSSNGLFWQRRLACDLSCEKKTSSERSVWLPG